MTAPLHSGPVFSVAKKTKRWTWVVWASRSDVHVSGSLLYMPDALAEGVANTAAEASAAAQAVAPSATRLVVRGRNPAELYRFLVKDRDKDRELASGFATAIKRDAVLLRLVMTRAPNMLWRPRLIERCPGRWPNDELMDYASEIVRGRVATRAKGVTTVAGCVRSDADTLDTRPWVADVATIHRALIEIGPPTGPYVDDVLYSRGEWERHFCWLSQMCLALPAWHEARTHRLPEFAGDLARARREGTPS